MGRQSAPLVVSLTAIAVLTSVSAATTPRTPRPDPSTTGAFVELAKRTGGTEVDPARRPAGPAPAAVVAPPPPRS